MYGQNIPSDRVVYKLNRGDVGNQVIEHFDGSKWRLFPGPKFQSTDQPALESLTAVSPSDMWAAGFILTNNRQSLFPLFEHFDGTSSKAFETLDRGGAACLPTRPTISGPWVSWKIVPSPSPSTVIPG